ncbi:MAG: hypothetical protein WC949_01065 [Candidatus Paceibacterota bacterium]|jgi:hypothetical protein
MEKRPNDQEVYFLNQSYNFFLDIHEEIMDKSFWGKDSYYRFNRIKDAILVYSEILEYEPIGWFLTVLKKFRPPMEAELSSEYLLFIRNLLIHFPLFKSWDEVKFTKQTINWSKPGRSIDKFLLRFSEHAPVKYRIWNHKDKTMVYVSINFPRYEDNTDIYLKSFMPEKEGVLFSISLIHRVLMSQVESIESKTGKEQSFT